MPVVKVTVSVKALEIIDHLARTLGISRSKAFQHFAMHEMMDWYGKFMHKEEEKIDAG